MSKQRRLFFHLPTPTGAESWTPEEGNNSVEKKSNTPFNRVCVMAEFVRAWLRGVSRGRCLLCARHLGFAVIEVACFCSSGKFLEFRAADSKLRQRHHLIAAQFCHQGVSSPPPFRIIVYLAVIRLETRRRVCLKRKRRFISPQQTKQRT